MALLDVQRINQITAISKIIKMKLRMKKLNKILFAGAFLLANMISLQGCSSSQSSSEGSSAAVVATEAAMENSADTSKLGEKAKQTIVVDVRTVDEWNNDGHANCSVNIPLQELEARMGELKGYGKIVLVCRSGNRAGTAKQMLEGSGYSNIENLGPWQNIQCK